MYKEDTIMNVMNTVQIKCNNKDVIVFIIFHNLMKTDLEDL